MIGIMAAPEVRYTVLEAVDGGFYVTTVEKCEDYRAGRAEFLEADGPYPTSEIARAAFEYFYEAELDRITEQMGLSEISLENAILAMTPAKGRA